MDGIPRLIVKLPENLQHRNSHNLLQFLNERVGVGRSSPAVSSSQSFWEQAVGALADGIRNIVLEGANNQRFTVEVRDALGRVLEVSAVLESKFFRKQKERRDRPLSRR